MKKFSYILISGILGLILASCAGGRGEYKVENMQTANLNITYSSSGSVYKICFKLKTDVESSSDVFKRPIGDFNYDSNRGFCDIVFKSSDTLVLIPKSFKYVYYKNDKATKTIDHTSGEITYTVHESPHHSYYKSEIYRTFKVSADTTTVNLTL